MRRRSRPANKGRRANTVRDQFIVDMIARIEEHGLSRRAIAIAVKRSGHDPAVTSSRKC